MHALWKHPELVLGQTCGWPLVTELWPLVTSGALNVVGTFWYHVSSDPGYYNAQHVYPNPMRDVYSPRSAVNSYDSLSGWVSHAYRNTEAITSVLLTGSHVETLRAIQSNTADMGTIDIAVMQHAFGSMYTQGVTSNFAAKLRASTICDMRYLRANE